MIVILVGIIITVVTAVPVLIQFRNHPRGLVILFFAEMWERFSYYGMRAILIFYLTQHFLFDDRFAQGQYAAYTSLVYLLTLLGGLVADRYLGNRKAIAFGALLLVAGHATMAVEGEPATQVLTFEERSYAFEVTGRGDARQVFLPVDGTLCAFNPREGGDDVCTLRPNASGDLEFSRLPETASLPAVLPADAYALSVEDRDPFYVNVLYLALALIIMGVGFLKASISSIVGQLYPDGDPRRDPGFTLYYYGINLGAFWASILCAYLGQTVGWWAGFGLAGVGMAVGYVVFVLGKSWLDGAGEPPEPEKLAEPVVGPLNREWLVYIGAILGVGVVFLMVQNHPLVGWALLLGIAPIAAYLTWFMATRCTAVEIQRMILAIILVAASVVFWSLFEQAGSSLNQFAERNTQLSVGGFAISAGQTQAFNAGFILIFAPAFAALWAYLGRLDRDPNTPLKFALALIQVGLGFMLLVWGVQFADDTYRVPLVFLAGAYLLHTTGELCLSPVGLSMITKLSVAAVVSTMMAVWFYSSSLAQYVGGIIAQLTATDTVAGQVLDPERALTVYADVFGALGLFAIGLGIVLGAASFWLKRLAHEGKDRLGDPALTTRAQPDPLVDRPAE